MRKETIYYVESGGNCGLIAAKRIETAKNEFIRDMGLCHLGSYVEVRKATKEDIAWVGGMGGYMPKV